ncbi:helix-turn-helix transcriptional regulator, partial [uncultured Clostridium sp.]
MEIKTVEQMTIGERIKYLRILNKLSQDDIEKYGTVCQDAIYKYEVKNVKPTIEVCNKLAKLFDVNVVDLLDLYITNNSRIEFPKNLLTFKEKIIFVQEKYYCSQRKFAKQLNIHIATYQQFITRDYQNIYLINDIAKKLNISTTDLFPFDYYYTNQKYNTKKSIPEMSELSLTNKILCLVSLYSNNIYEFLQENHITDKYTSFIKSDKKIYPRVSTINKLSQSLDIDANFFVMQDENMKISPYSYLENFNKMTIGQKIKYIRKQQNRSQKLLSEIAGVA